MERGHRQIKRSTTLLVICLFVLLGLATGKITPVALPSVALFLLLATPILYQKRTIGSIFLLVLIFFGLGLWRGSEYSQKLNQIKDLSGQKVVISAISEDDSIYTDNGQILFDASKVKLLSPYETELSGSFKISGFGEPMVYRGDQITVEGKMYSMRGSRQARMAFAQIQTTQSSTFWLDEKRREFSAGLASLVPEPAASLGNGILIGQRSGLPDEVVLAMTTVGLVHIVAVSGYNLTVLTRAIQRLRIKSAYQKLVASLLLIGTFVLITGFSASIVRAAFVSVLGLLAWYYGRQVKPMLLILFPAAVTAFVNPFYLWSDIGWYLSFTAFFGVLVLAPLIVKRFFTREPRMLGMVAVETFSAQIATLPIILAIFGNFAPVAFLANIMVVPVVPFAMLAAAIATIVGTLAFPVLALFAWPAILLLTYILDISTLLSRYTAGAITDTITWFSMALLYMLLALTSLTLWQKVRHKKTALPER